MTDNHIMDIHIINDDEWKFVDICGNIIMVATLKYCKGYEITITSPYGNMVTTDRVESFAEFYRLRQIQKEAKRKIETSSNM